MRAAAVAALVLALSAESGMAQQYTGSGFWKGKFETFQFNFSYAVGVQDKALVSRGTDLWQNDYDLYQNPAGIAREELTHMNRNRSVEGPLDIRLLDYKRGYGLVFDKGGEQAIRGPLAPVPGKALTPRRILGFACDGKEYEWTTFQHARVQLRSWSARDSDFKVPLLEVEYFTDDTGALLALTIQVVSKLEPVSELPSSLFQPRPGLHVVEVPSIR